MKYRLSFVVLLSLLVVSVVFNFIHYNNAVLAQESVNLYNVQYPKLITKLHDEIDNLTSGTTTQMGDFNDSGNL